MAIQRSESAATKTKSWNISIRCTIVLNSNEVGFFFFVFPFQDCLPRILTIPRTAWERNHPYSTTSSTHSRPFPHLYTSETTYVMRWLDDSMRWLDEIYPLWRTSIQPNIKCQLNFLLNFILDVVNISQTKGGLKFASTIGSVLQTERLMECNSQYHIQKCI